MLLSFQNCLCPPLILFSSSSLIASVKTSVRWGGFCAQKRPQSFPPRSEEEPERSWAHEAPGVLGSTSPPWPDFPLVRTRFSAFPSQSATVLCGGASPPRCLLRVFSHVCSFSYVNFVTMPASATLSKTSNPVF